MLPRRQLDDDRRRSCRTALFVHAWNVLAVHMPAPLTQRHADDGQLDPQREHRSVIPVVFAVAAGLAEHAELIAEFTSWTPLAMDRRADGQHSTTVLLRPGDSWRYRFVLDDDVINDPRAVRFDLDDAGELVSVVEVEPSRS